MFCKTLQLKSFTDSEFEALEDQNKSPLSTENSSINFECENKSPSMFNQFKTSFEGFSQVMFEDQGKEIESSIF
jgi:hypothetical protein